MYKALLSFTTIKSYSDVKKDEILASDFDTPEAIQEYLDIGYIEEYHGESGSDLDWSAIGYDSRPQAIVDGYNNALEIKNNWTSSSRPFDFKNTIIFCPYVDTSSQTSWYYFAGDCKKLLQLPLLDSSNVTNMSNAFTNCYALTSIPAFNTSKVTNFSSAFSNCTSLTNESLNNILLMCIGASSYTGTKTLYQLGFRSGNYASSIIQGLSNYQAFIDAGWTIGY